MSVRDVMRARVVFVKSETTIREFVESVAVHHRHTIFPVYENDKAIGTISVSDLSQVPPSHWDRITVGEIADLDAIRVTDDCDLAEALRLLVREGAPQMLLITDDSGAMQGVITKTDILRAVRVADESAGAGRITRRVPVRRGGGPPAS